MTALTIPNALTPGTNEDGADVQENFAAVRTWANGNIDDTNITSGYKSAPAYLVERPVATGFANVTSAGLVAADRYVMMPTGISTLKRSVGVIRIDPANYAVTGRTTTMRLRGLVVTNSTAPTVDVSVQLYAVTANAAVGAAIPDVTLGAAAGSAITFTSPSASTISSVQSATFSCPSAAYYVLVHTVSGNQAGGSVIKAVASLSVYQS